MLFLVLLVNQEYDKKDIVQSMATIVIITISSTIVNQWIKDKGEKMEDFLCFIVADLVGIFCGTMKK